MKTLELLKNCFYEVELADDNTYDVGHFIFASNKKEVYENLTKFFDSLEYKGQGFDIYISYDVSGFDYWIKNMREPNRMNLIVQITNVYNDWELVENARRIENILQEIDLLTYQGIFNGRPFTQVNAEFGKIFENN